MEVAALLAVVSTSTRPEAVEWSLGSDFRAAKIGAGAIGVRWALALAAEEEEEELIVKGCF